MMRFVFPQKVKCIAKEIQNHELGLKTIPWGKKEALPPSGASYLKLYWAFRASVLVCLYINGWQEKWQEWLDKSGDWRVESCPAFAQLLGHRWRDESEGRDGSISWTAPGPKMKGKFEGVMGLSLGLYLGQRWKENSKGWWVYLLHCSWDWHKRVNLGKDRGAVGSSSCVAPGLSCAASPADAPVYPRLCVLSRPPHGCLWFVASAYYGPMSSVHPTPTSHR